MKRLVIALTKERVDHTDQQSPIVIRGDTLGDHDLELYGIFWAKLWKTDIVMLVEEEV